VPRFFFHIEGGSALEDDAEGFDLMNIAEAKCEAVRFAGRLICDAASTFWDVGDFHMTVSDERGLTLFELRFVGTEAPSIRPNRTR